MKTATQLFVHFFNKTLHINVQEPREDHKRKFLNLVLFVSEIRALGIILSKLFPLPFFVTLNGMPLTIIDVSAALLYPILMAGNRNSFKVVSGYVYLMMIMLATGANLHESYGTPFFLTTAITLSIPIIVASFITKPFMSLVFSVIGIIEVILATSARGGFPEIPLVASMLFIGFLGGYTSFLFDRSLVLAKQNEQKYASLAKDLENQVKEKAETLAAVRGDLERQERMSVLGKFATTIAHDLRSPLSTVSNSVYLLNKYLSGANDDVRKNLDRIEKAVLVSQERLSEILEFVKIPKPVCKPTDLNLLINDVVKTLTIPPGISCMLELDKNLGLTPVDPAQMRRVLQNLLTNAIQSMEEGIGKVVISTRSDGRSTMVSISDTGSGISEENLKKMFKPFFTTKSQGIGLGMVVVKEIIDKHGAGIDIKSTVGEGTTITLSFRVDR